MNDLKETTQRGRGTYELIETVTANTRTAQVQAR